MNENLKFDQGEHDELIEGCKVMRDEISRKTILRNANSSQLWV